VDINDLTLINKYFSQWVYITNSRVDMHIIHIAISSWQQLINLLKGSTFCRHEPTVSKHNNDISIQYNGHVCVQHKGQSAYLEANVCVTVILLLPPPPPKSNIYEDINKLTLEKLLLL
jgi:hypothetical protein